MHLVRTPLATSDAALPTIPLRADRRTLAKRLWRSTAGDGTEFGFELERPIRHGEAFWQTASARYVIEQQPESVLTVELDAMPSSAAAAIGWAVGNLHLDFSSEPTRLLTPDEPAARQLFERIQVPFTATTAIFRAGRFARGNTSGSASATSAPAPHELGASHRH